MTQAVLIANAPQLLLSCVYILINNLFTIMMVGVEWESYATRRKALRVSTPKIGQRSTYFLQIPYRYSLPLVIIFGCSHWLTSQCIFPIAADEVDIYDGIHQFAPATCGYSPSAIVTMFFVMCALTLCVVMVGSLKYSGCMPPLRSSSAVISAACHSTDSQEITSLPLLRGVKDGEEAPDDESVPGHLAFSAEIVSTAVPGHVYA